MRLLLTLLFTAALSLSAQPVLPEVKLPPQAREVSAVEAQKLLNEQKDAGVLDVRTIEEVQELGRLPGAKHADFFREGFSKDVAGLGLDPAKPCLVYCALGGRARRAADTLAKAGYKDILVLKDGFNAWKKAGLPVEGGKTAK